MAVKIINENLNVLDYSIGKNSWELSNGYYLVYHNDLKNRRYEVKSIVNILKDIYINFLEGIDISDTVTSFKSDSEYVVTLKDDRYIEDKINNDDLKEYVDSELEKRCDIIKGFDFDNYATCVSIDKNVYFVIRVKYSSIRLLGWCYTVEKEPVTNNYDVWLSEKEMYDEYGLDEDEYGQELFDQAKKIFNTKKVYTSDEDHLMEAGLDNLYDLVGNLPSANYKVARISNNLAYANSDGYLYFYSPKKLSIGDVIKELEG